MQKKMPIMGSQDWTDQVFASPPARILRGPSRSTQYHRYHSSQLNMMIGVQGRNEYCAALAIEYLARLGIFRRVKPQPFVTDLLDFGAAIIPDFLAEGMGRTLQLYVIEMKSARFLTREKQVELETIRAKFLEYGIKYLVWTDQNPLSHPVRHHLINMRASSARDVPLTEIERLVAWSTSTRHPTLQSFYADNFDLDCLFAAAWIGKIFFPITKTLTKNTGLTHFPQEDYKQVFIDILSKTQHWWQSLEIVSGEACE